ncbi:MAG TPA: hypothetical protein VN684_05860 [Terriglobales bacterium]|nr:hypothetical protein [Terriglobales bacterium]
MIVMGHSLLHAQATLLLEEPYSYDGTFAGTGHSAVYLSRVCAATPVRLRRCRRGELGVVLSRYHGVAGYDWIAIPLIPYLYAVEKPSDIPLYADPKLVAFLRHQYLPHLKALARDDSKPTGATGRIAKDDVAQNEGKVLKDDEPSGPWYELVGSAYDRTLYGFQVATRPEQDDALIRKMNSSLNREAYSLLRRNCADFSKQIINFYYPHAAHRSIIGDLGVTTPKQVAKTLAHYSRHHPATEMTSFIIPQVPGMKRSKPTHGVLESVLYSKKYMAVLFFLHPIVAGTVETAYLTKWHFDPARNAMMFYVGRGLEPPLSEAERRLYRQKLDGMLAVSEDERASALKPADLKNDAEPTLDSAGRPVLNVEREGQIVQVGLCQGNALDSDFPQLAQKLLRWRVEEELKGGRPARASLRQMEADWTLLQQTTAQVPAEVAGEIQQ